MMESHIAHTALCPGAELLLTSFILSALKTSNLCSPIFFMSLAAQVRNWMLVCLGVGETLMVVDCCAARQCLLAVFLGSELIVQWIQLALALYSLQLMASTDDWVCVLAICWSSLGSWCLLLLCVHWCRSALETTTKTWRTTSRWERTTRSPTTTTIRHQLVQCPSKRPSDSTDAPWRTCAVAN